MNVFNCTEDAFSNVTLQGSFGLQDFHKELRERTKEDVKSQQLELWSHLICLGLTSFLAVVLLPSQHRVHKNTLKTPLNTFNANNRWVDSQKDLQL